METLVWGLLCAVIFFCALYFLVKAAVRDGILEAHKALGQPEPPQQEHPSEKEDG